jgi:hypothetical protein
MYSRPTHCQWLDVLEYLSELAKLIGEAPNVHFVKVAKVASISFQN